ncbi:hypothetical protein [Ruegeria sp. A3M17]|uniref:hypothetical protein n=1 Tax=Ruegeria sp. A3M17 TaxID=2267229 RepID=UPI000DEBAC93|nr:hypothetical protein [Ruegeria sp. A3M17]RBW54773.1 hypothetical protein DS906_14610 [Ruegeria sp. A3M17]
MKAAKVYVAKTKNLSFVNEEVASWLAIEALVISVGSGKKFYDLYNGLLGQLYFDWLRSHHHVLSTSDRAAALTNVVQFDRPRLYANEVMERVEDVFSEAVGPLGRAVSLIWKDGRTKSAALAEQAAYGSFLHRSDDPDHTKKWPKSLSDVSVRTLERKWSQYQCVLPHVMMIYLRQLAIQNDEEAPLASDLPAIENELSRKLISEAKTRKPNLEPWIELRFC